MGLSFIAAADQPLEIPTLTDGGDRSAAGYRPAQPGSPVTDDLHDAPFQYIGLVRTSRHTIWYELVISASNPISEVL